jgi:glutamyl-tRNA reductase
VAELQDVYLYTVDDLKTVIDEGQKSRVAAAEQAEEIINLQVGHFLEWVQLQTGAELIKSYRQQSEQMRDDALFRAKALLAAGKSPAEALDFLANTLTNRLIHHPTVVLREACASGDLPAVHAVQNVLGLADTPHR